MFYFTCNESKIQVSLFKISELFHDFLMFFRCTCIYFFIGSLFLYAIFQAFFKLPGAQNHVSYLDLAL